MFFLGLFVWSLAEYGVHRWILHRYCPRFHAIHHQDPLDGKGVPYSASLLIAAGCMVIAYVLGFFAFAAGLTVGYLLYVLIHEGMHRWRIEPGHVLYNNKLRHDVHHVGWRFNFGVTSPLWDLAFGTYHKGYIST